MPYASKIKRAEYNKRYHAEHAQELREYKQARHEIDSELHRQWRQANLEKRASDMRRWRSDIKNRIASNLRSRIANVLKGRTKFLKFKEVVGCSLDEFKSWVSGWFEPGMSWENYGDWELDHSKPCIVFDLSKEDEQRRCFHYLNLRPLWKSENRKKGGKYVVR